MYMNALNFMDQITYAVAELLIGSYHGCKPAGRFSV